LWEKRVGRMIDITFTQQTPTTEKINQVSSIPTTYYTSPLPFFTPLLVFHLSTLTVCNDLHQQTNLLKLPAFEILNTLRPVVSA
jgi:hypothetical protein